jgi:hypothetical protein
VATNRWMHDLEHQFWPRARRRFGWLLLLIALLALSAPSTLSAVVALLAAPLPAETSAIRHALSAWLACLSLLATVVIARLVPAAESRASLKLLVTAAVLSALGALCGGLYLLQSTRLHTGLALASALDLAPELQWAIVQGLELLWYLCLVGGMANVGFVPRRWAVLGVPTILLAIAARASLALQACTSASPFDACAHLARPELPAAFERALPALTLALVLASWLLLLLIVGEIWRSIRYVALARTADDPTLPADCLSP